MDGHNHNRDRISLALAACAVLLLAGSRAEADPLYTLTEPGNFPALTSSMPTGINSSGDFLVKTGNTAADNVFLDHNGVLSNLGSIRMVTGINDAGQFAGIDDSSGRAQNFMEQNGNRTRLPVTSTYLAAINNNGDVVTASGEYIYNKGAVTDIAPGVLLAVHGMNDKGEVVGGLSLAHGPHAFLVSNGVLTDIQQLLDRNATGYWGSQAVGINNSSQVLVQEYFISGHSAASIYNGKTGQLTELGTLPGGTSAGGGAINDLGQVAGISYPTGHIFLYSQGTMQDITNVTTGIDGWIVRGIVDLNDAGQMTGYGVDPSGQERAFLISPGAPAPVPEPSSLAILLGGAAYLARSRWRGRSNAGSSSS